MYWLEALLTAGGGAWLGPVIAVELGDRKCFRFGHFWGSVCSTSMWSGSVGLISSRSSGSESVGWSFLWPVIILLSTVVLRPVLGLELGVFWWVLLTCWGAFDHGGVVIHRCGGTGEVLGHGWDSGVYFHVHLGGYLRGRLGLGLFLG